MQIGDLVRYRSPMGEWNHILGVIIRQIPGTDEVQIVQWSTNGSQTGYPKRQLEVINAHR